MNYRRDIDLEFLEELPSEKLNDLVEIIINKNGVLGLPRLTEELTKSKQYKEYFPDHHKYWKVIASEIQKFGGNTIANLCRKEEDRIKSQL